jgi:hypothetical protein
MRDASTVMSKQMTPAAKLCLVACLLFFSSATASRAEDNIPKKQTFVVALQQTIRSNDKTWLAEHTRYPLRYYGRRKIAIRNSAAFVKNYPALIGAKLRAAVLAQNPENVFENWQGLMVGDGDYNIWIRNEGADLQPRYLIIAINDAE